MKDFDSYTNIASNVRNLGKIIVATGFEKLLKVQKITQSGHTASRYPRYVIFQWKEIRKGECNETCFSQATSNFGNFTYSCQLAA